MLAARPRKTLDVPALGGPLDMLGLTARDMTEVMKGPDGAAGNALMLARSLYRDGKRIIDGNGDELLDLPHEVFSMLLAAASALNNVSQGAAKSAEKNSGATTDDGSSSG